MNTIDFGYPVVFWALLVIPILALLFIGAERWRKVALGRLLAARLQPRLAGSVSIASRRWAFAIFCLGVALCITAIARPRWGTTSEEIEMSGRDVIFAMDTSRSMLAQDVAPNRIERAKLAALDLMSELAGDRLGIVAFAGEAFVQAPLTPDHGAVEELIRGLDTEQIGQGGSNLRAAIDVAEEAFGKGEGQHRALILFSDGEELQEDAIAAARRCKDKFRIYSVGVGTQAGAPIILQSNFGSEYVRNEEGKVVTTKLVETKLREVAEAAGGFYLRLENGPADMRHLARTGLEAMIKGEQETRTKEVPNERFQWPLCAGILCIIASALIGERRRTVIPAVALALALFPAPSHAQSGVKGYLNQVFDSQAPVVDAPNAAEELERIEAQRRRRPGVAEIDFNAGCSAFSAGDFEKAVAAFSTALGSAEGPLRARSAHNLGNALARRGVKQEKEQKLVDWTNAVKQYDTALSLDPGNEQTRKNRDAVLRAIEELKKEEEKKEGQKKEEQKKDDQKKEEKKDQEQKKDENSKGDKQDKQDQEKQDGKGDENEQKEKNGETKEDKDGKQKGNEAKPEDSKQGEAPKPEDMKQDQGKPKDGKLEEAQPRQPGEEQSGSDGKAGDEASEAMQAAKEGRMTEKDAKALIQAAGRNERFIPPLRQLLERSNQNRPNGKNW